MSCREASRQEMGERQSIAQKGVCAIVARNPRLEMAQMLQKPVFVLPGFQQMSVNTLLCDTVVLAAQKQGFPRDGL